MKKARTIASIKKQFLQDVSAAVDRAIVEIEKLPTATKRELDKAYDLSGTVSSSSIEDAASPAVKRRLMKLEEKFEILYDKKALIY